MISKLLGRARVAKGGPSRLRHPAGLVLAISLDPMKFFSFVLKNNRSNMYPWWRYVRRRSMAQQVCNHQLQDPNLAAVRIEHVRAICVDVME